MFFWIILLVSSSDFSISLFILFCGIFGIKRPSSSWIREWWIDKLGIAKSYINKIENRKFTNVTVNLLNNIALELNLDKHELLDWLLTNNID